jgi:RNA polymerase-binding transcription factor DksA
VLSETTATDGIRRPPYTCETMSRMAAEYDRTGVEARLRERAEELARTRRAVSREGDGMVSSELADIDQHPADQGTETHEQELDATTEIFLDDEGRRIEEARQALARGTYGICADCGRDIPAERLEAVPEAVRCIECQRLYEGFHRIRANRSEGGAADFA